MKTTQLPKPNQTGFTLLEALIAMTILAVGLLALAGMQITSIRGNATAQGVTAKVAFAEGIIEKYLAMNPGATAGTHIELLDDPLAGAGTLQATVVVTDDPTLGATTYSGLTEIEVTVSSLHQPNKNIVKTVMQRRL